jgi:uncharacterized membrane protein
MSKNTDVNDPDNYKWGLFYFNRDDLRGIVPKRNQWMGWTLNFAQPLAWVIILGIVAFVVIMNYFGK